VSDLDVRMFTVGPVQENAYIVIADPRSDDAGGRSAGGRGRPAVMVDPGEEPERLLAAARALEAEVQAILITHCHFDHIGAVAPVARATGAPVYCPQIERPLLTDIMAWVPPGFGPFENWEPEHTVAGGERLSLAGLDIEVLFTPGHSPGHVTYAIAPSSTEPAAQGPDGGTAAGTPAAEADAARALLSGDVLFQGSVGRVDLPGGDWNVLEQSIGTLMRAFAPQTTVYPGHMGVTTLGRELQTNPFLAELRAAEAPVVEVPVPGRAAESAGR
jgi:hydroxyacylglutathione hydrolase